MNKTLKNFAAIFGFVIGVCVFVSAIAVHFPTPRLHPTEDPTISAEYEAPVVWARWNLKNLGSTGKAHAKRLVTSSDNQAVSSLREANEAILAAIEREAAQISANIVGAQVEMSGEFSTAKEYHPVMSHHVRAPQTRVIIGEITIESHPSYVKQ